MKEKQVKPKRNHLPHFGRRTAVWTTYAASNGMEALLLGYMSFYLTDSVLMAAGTVGVIIALSRVFDGISDVIAGFIIDRTNTRWGKARPYSIFSLVMWAAAVLLFSVPEMSNTGKIIYVFIMYNLADTVSRTMLFASESVHCKRAFNSDEQLDVVGVAGLVAGIVNMVVGVVMPLLINSVGQTKEGWTIIALCLAIPGGIMGTLKLFLLPELDMKEVLEKKKEQHVSVKESVVALLHNKYILLFLVVGVARYIITGMAMHTYYFTYIVGNLDLYSVVSMVGLLSMVVMPFIPALTRKLGIRKFATIFLFAGAVAYVSVYAAPTNIILLAVSSAVTLLAGLPVSMLENLVAIQCMKYSEWREGKKIEGVIASMNGVSHKVGQAIGAMLVGFLLQMSGYDGALAVQSGAASNMIIFLYVGLPAILMLISAICMNGYRLEDKLDTIEAELAARRETVSNG